MSEDYEKAFREEEGSLEALRGEFSSADVAMWWQEFVEGVLQGYNDILIEYEFDLQLRDKIEELLSSPRLNQFEQHSEFRQRIENSDNRLKPILIPKEWARGETWWQTSMPSYGKKAYCDSITDADSKQYIREI